MASDYFFNADSIFGAAERGDIIKTEALLSENPQLAHAKTANGGITALMIAAGQGKKDIVELLISKGADVNAKDGTGMTALFRAMVSKDILELLLSSGADINVKALKGMTPLMFFTLFCEKTFIELLIHHGAEVNAKSDKDLIDILGHSLISNSTEANIKNNNGWTALMFAEARGEKDIADLLRKHGAKE
ncbi:MAG: ankyrin repeat domain-containing protein [Candidatus Eremiobacteraeota bacterium]|nr:ankyrin repeat domain-containing protein [Candidatus Eremiobacteraeota bacterium]